MTEEINCARGKVRSSSPVVDKLNRNFHSEINQINKVSDLSAKYDKSLITKQRISSKLLVGDNFGVEKKKTKEREKKM